MAFFSKATLVTSTFMPRKAYFFVPIFLNQKCPVPNCLIFGGWKAVFILLYSMHFITFGCFLLFLFQPGWVWRVTKEGGVSGKWESNSQRRASESIWRMQKTYIWKWFHQGNFADHSAFRSISSTFITQCKLQVVLLRTQIVSLDNNCCLQEELERLCGPEAVANLE